LELVARGLDSLNPHRKLPTSTDENTLRTDADDNAPDDSSSSSASNGGFRGGAEQGERRLAGECKETARIEGNDALLAEKHTGSLPALNNLRKTPIYSFCRREGKFQFLPVPFQDLHETLISYKEFLKRHLPKNARREKCKLPRQHQPRKVFFCFLLPVEKGTKTTNYLRCRSCSQKCTRGIAIEKPKDRMLGARLRREVLLGRRLRCSGCAALFGRNDRVINVQSWRRTLATEQHGGKDSVSKASGRWRTRREKKPGRYQLLVQQYGPLVVVFHTAVWAVTLTGLFVGMHLEGTDIDFLLDYAPDYFVDDARKERLLAAAHSEAGKFAIAYVLTLASGPLRLGFTVLATPGLSKFLTKLDSPLINRALLKNPIIENLLKDPFYYVRKKR